MVGDRPRDPPELTDRLDQAGWSLIEALDCVPLVDRRGTSNRPRPTHRLFIHYDTAQSGIDLVDAWYEEEHEDMLFRAPAWSRIRRFRTGTPDHPGRLVVHDVSDPEVISSEELRVAMATSRRAELARLGWFTRSPRCPWEMVDPA